LALPHWEAGRQGWWELLRNQLLEHLLLFARCQAVYQNLVLEVVLLVLVGLVVLAWVEEELMDWLILSLYLFEPRHLGWQWPQPTASAAATPLKMEAGANQRRYKPQ